MKFNNVTPVAPAFLLCVGSPNAGGQVTLRIEKYEETNVVNHPSLEQYVRDTFDVVEIPTDFEDASPLTIARAVQIAINRVANDITANTFRGSPKNLMVGPNTTIVVPAVDGQSLHDVTVLDWLAPNECLLVLGGDSNKIDNGFVWAAKDDGTVDINAQPNVALYGRFLKVV